MSCPDSTNSICSCCCCSPQLMAPRAGLSRIQKGFLEFKTTGPGQGHSPGVHPLPTSPFILRISTDLFLALETQGLDKSASGGAAPRAGAPGDLQSMPSFTRVAASPARSAASTKPTSRWRCVYPPARQLYCLDLVVHM